MYMSGTSVWYISGNWWYTSVAIIASSFLRMVIFIEYSSSSVLLDTTSDWK
jgi:hypothetical protein